MNLKWISNVYIIYNVYMRGCVTCGSRRRIMNTRCKRSSLSRGIKGWHRSWITPRRWPRYIYIYIGWRLPLYKIKTVHQDCWQMTYIFFVVELNTRVQFAHNTISSLRIFAYIIRTYVRIFWGKLWFRDKELRLHRVFMILRLDPPPAHTCISEFLPDARPLRPRIHSRHAVASLPNSKLV